MTDNLEVSKLTQTWRQRYSALDAGYQHRHAIIATARLLNSARRRAQLTDLQMAKLLGLSVTDVRRMQSSLNDDLPDPETIAQFLKHCDVCLDDGDP